MSVTKVIKRFSDYTSSQDVVKILSREHNLVVDQANTNETAIAANLAAAKAGTSVTTTNVGTAATGVTAAEYGDGNFHKTVLTISSTMPAIAGGADLAVGKLIYTLPAGANLVTASYMDVTLTAADGNIDADTPDVGIGTTIASGAVALLSGTAGFQNIHTGQTATDCSGTATVSLADITAGTALPIHTGNPHTVYLNIADGWAASGETACPVTGTVILYWSFVV